MLEWELVRQAGEEGNSGDSWLDRKPRGPRHPLYLTHKETEAQRGGSWTLLSLVPRPSTATFAPPAEGSRRLAGSSFEGVLRVC